MAVIHAARHGLRRDDAAKPGSACELLVPVDGIGVVHRHDPAPDVHAGAGIAQLPAPHRLADARIDVAQIESCRSTFLGTAGQGLPPARRAQAPRRPSISLARSRLRAIGARYPSFSIWGPRISSSKAPS